MRRAMLPWLVALGLAVLVATGVVVALNATVFGAGSFVRVYLDAVARDDLTGALAIPGVRPAAGGTSTSTGTAPNTALLHDGTLAGLTELHETGDETRGDTQLISYAWTSPGGSGSTTFEVRRVGTRFGLFPEWAFAVSPTATVSLTVEHDPRFTVNGVDRVSTTLANTPVGYTVLVPGAYTFAHRSRYLSAQPDHVLADTVGATLTGVVDTRANAAFVSAVSRLVDSELAKCAAQTVLFPSGCPFGQSVDNRVSGAPAWSIVQNPRLSIAPGVAFESWAIPTSPGTAHLDVAVTSLFDGSTSEFQQDVPFLVQADITLGADDSISVTLR